MVTVHEFEEAVFIALREKTTYITLSHRPSTNLDLRMKPTPTRQFVSLEYTSTTVAVAAHASDLPIFAVWLWTQRVLSLWMQK